MFNGILSLLSYHIIIYYIWRLLHPSSLGSEFGSHSCSAKNVWIRPKVLLAPSLDSIHCGSVTACVALDRFLCRDRCRCCRCLLLGVPRPEQEEGPLPEGDGVPAGGDGGLPLRRLPVPAARQLVGVRAAGPHGPARGPAGLGPVPPEEGVRPRTPL